MALSEYPVALVTGASSGIGAGVVRILSKRGCIVHAAARRKERLVRLARETDCLPLEVDLRDTDRLYETLGDLQLDIVVNNAGVGRGFGCIFEAAAKDIDATIDTNVGAAIHVLRACLPGMVQRKRGHIVNISSTAALYPIMSSLYGASKGAVHLLSQNLRLELAGTGVRVTEICPGRVRTEFFDAAIDDREIRDRIKESGIHEMQPEDIANAVVYALDTPRHVNVNLIELQPTEQQFGGMRFVPVD